MFLGKLHDCRRGERKSSFFCFSRDSLRAMLRWESIVRKALFLRLFRYFLILHFLIVLLALKKKKIIVSSIINYIFRLIEANLLKNKIVKNKFITTWIPPRYFFFSFHFYRTVKTMMLFTWELITSESGLNRSPVAQSEVESNLRTLTFEPFWARQKWCS